jgi:hypothetical protein
MQVGPSPKATRDIWPYRLARRVWECCFLITASKGYKLCCLHNCVNLEQPFDIVQIMINCYPNQEGANGMNPATRIMAIATAGTDRGSDIP